MQAHPTVLINNFSGLNKYFPVSKQHFHAWHNYLSAHKNMYYTMHEIHKAQIANGYKNKAIFVIADEQVGLMSQVITVQAMKQ
ncbi:MAG TPA: hypothetical protein VII99_05250 [Bacteroidia bacterium]